MIKKINHVGFAVKDIDTHLKLLSGAFGAEEIKRKSFAPMGQTSCILSIGEGKYELMEPYGDQPGVVSRFLEKRGEGFHHISLLSDDLEGDVAKAESAGIRFVTKLPDAAFTDPKTSGGIVYEITTME